MSLDHLNHTAPPQQPEDNDDLYNAFEQVNTPVYDDKPRKVSRLTLSLIIASIVVLVLGCAVLGFVFFSDDSDSEPSSDGGETEVTDPVEDNSLTLLDKTDNGKVVLRQVDFRNEEDTFTIYYNEKDGKFLLKGYEDIDLSNDVVDLLKEYTTTIIATDQVKDPGALKDYGLDKPSATATITYHDGSTATLKLGKALSTKDGYYGMVDSKEGIYMFDTDSVSLFRFRSTAFADTVLLSTPTVKKDDANGSALLKEIRYTGKQFSDPLTIRRSYRSDSEEMQLFSYIITEPFLRGTTDDVSGYLSSFKSLSADQALFLHPSAQQKEKLGFNDPLIKIRFTMAVETSEEGDEEEEQYSYYNEVNTDLTIGSIDSDGNYVVMVNGIDAIFLLNQDTFSTIADRTYENSVNELLFLKSIDQLGRISIQIGDDTNDFELKHYPNAENLDDQMKITADGKQLSTADFRELYQLLMGLARIENLEKMPEGKPVMTVKMYTTEGDFYMGATYYSLSGTLCAVETTEGEIFTTRWRNVTHFMEQVTNYLNGDKVLIMTY